jgi:hypothetical protein
MNFLKHPKKPTTPFAKIVRVLCRDLSIVTRTEFFYSLTIFVLPTVGIAHDHGLSGMADCTLPESAWKKPWIISEPTLKFVTFSFPEEIR